MLMNAKDLKGYRMESLDGELGRVKEFYFDDEFWTIRYLVANTATWLTGRKVLIAPHALGKIKKYEQQIEIKLTKKQIQDSPALDTERPVSHQWEEEYYTYYGWPVYWGGPMAWGGYPYIMMSPNAGLATHREEGENTHLRSTHAVEGNTVQAADGDIGHIDDFIIDDATWAIRYVVVDTKNWWPGKKVLISPKWFDSIDWLNAKVLTTLTREAIREAPEYTPTTLIERDYELALHSHYNLEGYWTKEGPALTPAAH